MLAFPKLLSSYFFATLFLICCGSSIDCTFAEDSPQFRGADARGVSDNPSLPVRWSETENILWKQPISGRGWSSPITFGNHVYVTTVTQLDGKPEDAKPGLYFGGDRKKPEESVHEWNLQCFQLSDGKPLWKKTLHKGKPATPRHIKNSYASETPVTDGEHIYALFGDVGLYCVSKSGELVWSKELPPCKTRYDWGTAASPVLHGDRLYFVSDTEEQSYIAAIDKKSGEEIWRKNRAEGSNWATPFIWQNKLRTEIITPGTGKIRSYDLDGKLLYEFGGCSSITIATPYTAHDLLYVSSGYVLDKKKPIFALKPGAKGNISLSDKETSNEFIAWCQKQEAPYNPSTLVYKDQLYVLQDRGFLTSFNAKTGEEIYGRKRLPSQAFTASPWAANDMIYCLNEFGETYVFQAGKEFKLLHTNKLETKGLSMSTPAMVDGRLLLRTAENLYCIGKNVSN
ncbi:PQQ-binding-like beta-propeller repeat protein [Planctomicrobium sp.]|jgi:outer membrane protein assembly factor BamB|nr:PQQ-binding-like beta-propeller repeat protein [Planctomicrobium sp.]MDA7527993.1 PQQ-binding-like beta-propeller repeat protein [bacterium]MDB4733186.1 PQQ-binding-like beta-propeller repeat protein [Planctomicrobium sp.]MDB4743555.1 PQQ-binding-like beta-propeller repeat protein [Planctomicrobium sp.]